MSNSLVEELCEVMDRVTSGIDKALEKNITNASGFKLMVAKDVPKDEIWFYNSNNDMHVLKNVSINFNMEIPNASKDRR